MSQARGNSGLIWGVLALGGYLLFKTVIKPDIIKPVQTAKYVTRLRVNLPAVRFKGDNVEFDLYIQNPNPGPLTIQAIVGDVFVTYGGQQMKMGNVDKYGNTVIKPLAETKFTFSVRLKALPLIKYFTDMLAGKATGQVLSFKGTVTVDGTPYPVTESLKIS